MSLATNLLGLATDAALGVWLGSVVFFSFLGAPTVFSVLPEDDAGRVVNAVFPKYYVFGVALGIAATAAVSARLAVASVGPALAVALGATLLGVVAFAYSRWVLVPKMEAAGADAFERYHQQSVMLNGLAMLAVAAALVGSRFA